MYRCIKVFHFLSFSYIFLAAKNRTSSPSSTSLHQPTNISVSSFKLKRETSPTVCCYNINSRFQSVGESHQSEENFERFADAKRANTKSSSSSFLKSSKCADFLLNKTNSQQHKSVVCRDVKRPPKKRENINEIYLRDKIRRFENLPNNIQENIINRPTTTTTRNEKATAADVDPVKSVSEDDQRICDVDKNSFSATVLINRDESQSSKQTISDEKCNWTFLKDANNNNNNNNTNNNNFKVRALESDTKYDSLKSSLIDARQLHDTKDINKRYCFNGDNTKVTKVVIRHLAPLAFKKKSQVDIETSEIVQKKQNSFDDNDFSFIDSSSRSVSRSSSLSFASDDFISRDETNVSGRKARIPKITKINGCNYNNRGSFSVKTCANQKIYSLDQSKKNSLPDESDTNKTNHLNETTSKKFNTLQHLTATTYNDTSSNFIHHLTSENLVSVWLVLEVFQEFYELFSCTY